MNHKEATAIDRLLADVEAAEPAYHHKIIGGAMFIECADRDITWDAVPPAAEYSRPIAVIEEYDGEQYVVEFDEFRLPGPFREPDEQTCWLVPGDCREIPADAVGYAAWNC